MTDVGCGDGVGCGGAVSEGAAVGCSFITSVDGASADELADFALLSQESVPVVSKKLANATNEVVRIVIDAKIGDYAESLRTKSWHV